VVKAIQEIIYGALNPTVVFRLFRYFADHSNDPEASAAWLGSHIIEAASGALPTSDPPELHADETQIRGEWLDRFACTLYRVLHAAAKEWRGTRIKRG
jgi:hypothetical protein